MNFPEDLKPCPFCGNEHLTLSIRCGFVYIACAQCQTEFACDCTAGHSKNSEETIKRWNRRSEVI